MMMFMWRVRFAAFLLHSAPKQPYFVGKHENLVPEEGNGPLQELIETTKLFCRI